MTRFKERTTVPRGCSRVNDTIERTESAPLSDTQKTGFVSVGELEGAF